MESECLGYTVARLVHIQTRYVPRHRSPCRPDLPKTVSTSSGHALACPPLERYLLCASSPVCIYRSSTEHMWPSVCPPRSQYIYRFTLLQPAYRLYIVAPSFEIPPLRSALHPAVLQPSNLLVTIRPGSRVATLGSIFNAIADNRSASPKGLEHFPHRKTSPAWSTSAFAWCMHPACYVASLRHAVSFPSNTRPSTDPQTF
jgi:hypothetical protein